MMDVKLVMRYLFVLPYVGGILAIISLFVPGGTRIVANITIDSHTVWIWGFLCIIDWRMGVGGWGWDNTFQFLPDVLMVTISIILTVLIFIASLIIVLKARSFGKDEKDLDFRFVKYGLILLILISLWVIAVQIYYSITGYFLQFYIDNGLGTSFSFWSYFDVNFGVIGIYIGGGLSISGYIALKIIYKQYDYLFV
jgi:hypothetical protein